MFNNKFEIKFDDDVKTLTTSQWPDMWKVIKSFSNAKQKFTLLGDQGLPGMPGISGRKGERGSKGESGSCVVECNRANALDRFGLERWVLIWV